MDNISSKITKLDVNEHQEAQARSTELLMRHTNTIMDHNCGWLLTYVDRKTGEIAFTGVQMTKEVIPLVRVTLSGATQIVVEDELKQGLEENDLQFAMVNNILDILLDEASPADLRLYLESLMATVEDVRKRREARE